MAKKPRIAHHVARQLALPPPERVAAHADRLGAWPHHPVAAVREPEAEVPVLAVVKESLVKPPSHLDHGAGH